MKATKATAASASTPASVNRPDSRGAANTSRFLDHWRGRVARTSSRTTLEPGAGPGSARAIEVPSDTVRRVARRVGFAGRTRQVIPGRHAHEIGERRAHAPGSPHSQGPRSQGGPGGRRSLRRPGHQLGDRRRSRAALPGCPSRTRAGRANGWPHSVPPTPTSVPHPRWSWWTKEPGRASRAALAAADYGSAALLRVAVCDDGRRLAVGAHHGAVDGLGLVAVAGAALGQPLLTRARGIGDRPARSGFLRSSLGRLGEALVDPPPRFAGQGEVSPVEDLSELTATAPGSRNRAPGRRGRAGVRRPGALTVDRCSSSARRGDRDRCPWPTVRRHTCGCACRPTPTSSTYAAPRPPWIPNPTSPRRRCAGSGPGSPISCADGLAPRPC